MTLKGKAISSVLRIATWELINQRSQGLVQEKPGRVYPIAPGGGRCRELRISSLGMEKWRWQMHTSLQGLRRFNGSGDMART
jgi:hypothetical protein